MSNPEVSKEAYIERTRIPVTETFFEEAESVLGNIHEDMFANPAYEARHTKLTQKVRNTSGQIEVRPNPKIPYVSLEYRDEDVRHIYLLECQERYLQEIVSHARVLPIMSDDNRKLGSYLGAIGTDVSIEGDWLKKNWYLVISQQHIRSFFRRKNIKPPFPGDEDLAVQEVFRLVTRIAKRLKG